MTGKLLTHRAALRLLDGLGDPVALLGPDWRYIYVNDAVALYTGVPVPSLLGQVCWEIFPHLEGEPVGVFMREVMAGRRASPARIETYLDVRRSWFALVMSKTRDGLVVTWRDVTERHRAEERLRRAEERFRLVFEYAPIGIALTSPAGFFLQCNARFTGIVGYSEAELRETAFPTLVHEDDRAANVDVARRLERGEVASFELENRYVRRDGRTVWVHKIVSMVRDDAGHPAYAVALVTDVTARRRADEARLASEAKLRLALEARDEFLSVASHELRTPLTALSLQLERLARLVPSHSVGADREALAKPVSVTLRQAGRLASLVDGLLDVSRIATGRLVLQRREVELCALVRDVLERMSALAARARCDVRTLLPAESVGYWDRERIEAVLVNLLGNAFKYGANAPVEVAIAGDRHEATITVRDHGIGIAFSDQSRIFRQFERAAPTSQYGGLGLGLYIARELVVAHGGEITVASAPGEGATFTVRLPRGLVSADARRSEGRDNE